jgi:beta-mannosidase
VPLDIFPSRVSKEQYKKLFSDLRTSNVNMIRVWGGGIYEDDYFYQLADENGILVWQDFMFSGAMYPSDSAFMVLVKAEAAYNVKRLRNHPSLALWCGNNEIQVAWDNWGWQQTYSLSKASADSMYSGYKKIFDEVLPAAVSSLDSGVFYFPSSPQSNWGKPADFKSGDNHYWGVWHGEKPVESFTKDIPRFASEFGLPSLPEMQSVARFAPASSLESPLIKDRMRSYKGLGLLKKYADNNYPVSTTLGEFSYITNVLQADAVVSAIIAQRASKPYCMGSLYWQANDCWPGITWSSIDYYGKWKALQYRMKDAFSNLSMTLKTDSLKSVFSIINDGYNSNSAMLDLHIENFEGLDLWRKSFYVKIKANENTTLLIDSLFKIESQLGRDKIDLVAILYNDEGVLLQQHFFFDKTKNLVLPDVVLSTDVCEYGKGYMLTLSTVNLAKNVYLSLANGDATFSDNYFDMLPGDVRQIEISSALPINEVISNLKIRTMKGERP